MIHSFAVTNYLGDRIDLELRRPELSGFLIKSITGLGPSKATISTAEMATIDGTRYKHAKMDPRNIVIQLIFVDNNDGYSIEDLRQKTYKFFPVKKKVELLFQTDNRYAKTVGYVESNEPNIFSSQEGTQISIICPDPYFYSAGRNGTVTTEFYSIVPNFEFPFCNDSVSDPLISMGEIDNKSEGVLVYTGDAEVGVSISIHAIGPAQGITASNIGTGESMSLDTDKIAAIIGSPIAAKDDILINTVKGEKSVHLIRNGVFYNILNSLDKNADWLTVTKGENLFRFSAESGITNLQFSIQHKVVYGGI